MPPSTAAVAGRFHRRFHHWDWRRETGMVSRQTIWRRKRCAEDPEYQDKGRARCRAWWAANKDEYNARRRTKQHKRYGISDEEYQALLARQGGVCGICKKKRRPLCVDHCHITGKVRGLLCHKCNLGLGHYDDDPVLTRAATAYLEASLRDPVATGPRRKRRRRAPRRGAQRRCAPPRGRRQRPSSRARRHS